ncbi:MAG: hypothetical protein ACPG32_13745 [Akkermansiaceae bacterium]
MQDKQTPTKGQAFRAKLRHYHRSASPEFFSRKRKRWENLSQQEFSDSVSGGISPRQVPSGNVEES